METISHSVTAFSTATVIVQIINILLLICRIVVITYLVILLIKVLKKHIKPNEIHSKKDAVCKSLGEVLKEHRTSCKMTQEFVAEHLGVSRQAVSKWENGTSDPSTSNLLALAKLYDISAEELLKQVQE